MFIRWWRHLAAAGLLGLLPTAPSLAGPLIHHWEGVAGSRGYFVQARELPIVDLQLIFSAGSNRDGAHPGLATLVSGMLFEGTVERDADEIARGFDALGVEYGATANRDQAVITLRSLSDPDHLEPALALLGSVLAGANFPDKAFSREKRNRLLALRAEQERPASLAERHFFRLLYGDHPYAHSPQGDEQSVQEIQRNHLMEFKNRYYVGANATLAIVGDLDRKQAEAISQRLLGGLPAGAAPPPLPAVTPLVNALRESVFHPSTQTHILIGQPVLSRDDPDYFPLYLGNHILGGSGLVSRISKEIREKKGLAYAAYSYFQPMKQKGPFTIGMQTKNDQAGEALTILDSVLRDFIDRGPEAGELNQAKKNIAGGFPLRLDSNKKILAYVGMIGFHQLPLDYLDTFVEKIEAVSAAQVRSAFQRRVDPQTLVWLTLGGQEQNQAR